MDYSRMRELVEDYFLHIRERDRILTDFADPTHRIKKVTGESSVSLNKSTTERKALSNIARDNMVASVTKKIEYVDSNLDVLTKDERRIINYIKYGDKLTSISRTTGIERRKVAGLRDSAIHKMVEKVNRLEGV